MTTPMQYLYSDGDIWYFMEPETFEQHGAGAAAVADAKPWLKEQMLCKITLWNGQPLLVEPPPHVELKIVQTDPGRARRYRDRRHEAGDAGDGRRGQGAAVRRRGRSHQGGHAHQGIHLPRSVSRGGPAPLTISLLRAPRS